MPNVVTKSLAKNCAKFQTKKTMLKPCQILNQKTRPKTMANKELKSVPKTNNMGFIKLARYS